MTETTTLTYAEIKKVLSIFFDLPEDEFQCWNTRWSFNASKQYLENKIKENTEKLKA